MARTDKVKPKEYHVTLLEEHMELLKELATEDRRTFRQTLNIMIENEINKRKRKGK